MFAAVPLSPSPSTSPPPRPWPVDITYFLFITMRDVQTKGGKKRTRLVKTENKVDIERGGVREGEIDREKDTGKGRAMVGVRQR